MKTSRTRFTTSIAFGLLGIAAPAGCAGPVPAAAPATNKIIAPGERADLANITSADPSGSLTKISGLSDTAFGGSKGPVASVWFSQGDTLVAIVVTGGSTGGLFLDRAKAVAAAALGRL